VHYRPQDVLNCPPSLLKIFLFLIYAIVSLSNFTCFKKKYDVHLKGMRYLLRVNICTIVWFFP